MLNKLTVFKLQFKTFIVTLTVLVLVGTLAGYLPPISAGSHNLNHALAIDEAVFRELE